MELFAAKNAGKTYHSQNQEDLTNMSTQQSCALLDLSLELRNIIYSCFDTKRYRLTVAKDRGDGEGTTGFILCHSFRTSLARVCKQINKEYVEVAFKKLGALITIANDPSGQLDKFVFQDGAPLDIIQKAKSFKVNINPDTLISACWNEEWNLFARATAGLPPEEVARLPNSPANGMFF